MQLVQIMLMVMLIVILMVIILFLFIKDTKLYVPEVTLAERDNQKLSKRLIKAFERSVYWNVKQKVRLKLRQMNLDNFETKFFKSQQIICISLFKWRRSCKTI